MSHLDDRCESVLITAFLVAALVTLVPRVSSAQSDGSDGSEQAPSQTESAERSENTQSNGGMEASGSEKLELGMLLNPDIESASLIAEPASEAPAPVTVITSDMIEAIGARNLQEVLATYVPGMTTVEDKNELNIALRGIYTSSQQKMLVLMNGHRLNSRTFSSAPPDFSIGIHPSKIKQIEVIRGPGSSVYGNLALNGIINIVTKDPADLNEVEVNAGVGTFGQRTASATAGKQFSEDHGLVLWASTFRSSGKHPLVEPHENYNKFPADERDNEPEPRMHLMAFQDPASFDVGGQYEVGDFTLFADARQGKYVPPYTSGGNTGGQTYEYDHYRPWNGAKSGLASWNAHLELSYDTELGEEVSFSSSVYLDGNRTQQHLIPFPREGIPVAVGWHERTVGNISHFDFNYDLGPVGGGTLVLGGQADIATVVDSYAVDGVQDGEFDLVVDSKDEPALPRGTERIYSGFAQLKHAFGFNRDVVANVGARYDYKDRHDFERDGEKYGEDVTQFSPRTALIIGPDYPVGMKFSYSESFVDAPYWLRYNTLRNFRGTPDLRPEKMRAYQLTPTLRLFDEQLRSSTNFYYVTHSDVIFRKQTLDPDANLFQNSGQLSVAGIEEELAYLERDFRIRGNVTFNQPVRHTRYPITGNEIHNVPKLFGNLTLDVKPLWFATNEELWLGVSARYYAGQLSPVDIRYRKRSGGRVSPTVVKKYQEPNRTVDQQLLFRANLRWREILDSNFNVQLTANNLLDTTYHQGGTTSHPYRQPGRWFLVQLGYKHGM